MASTYSANNGMEKPAKGDLDGTWGDMVNENMDIIDRALSGVGTITLSGTTHTLTTTDGATTDGQFKVLVLSGSPSGTNTITISPNDQQKIYFVVNSSGQSAIFTQGSGANVTVPNGGADIIYADGNTGSAAVTSILSKTLTTGNIIIPNAGNIGSASDTDAIAISSGGVVTMNQIPVFSAGINASGGTITGVALSVDDVAVDGKVITMTGSSSDTAVFTAGTNGTLSIVTTDDSAAAANITITADGTFEADGTTVTLDSEGDIVLDANGADVIFKDDGTAIGTLTNSSSDFVITSNVQDKDIIFKGDDGGSPVTALTLDMSAAGNATFNNSIYVAEEAHFGATTAASGIFEILDGVASGTSSEVGWYLAATGGVVNSGTALSMHYINFSGTTTSTINFIIFRYRGSTIGDIDTADRTVVRYNTFTGAHWSELSSGSVPPKGTIMSSSNEKVVYTKFNFTDTDGEPNSINVIGTHSKGATKNITFNETSLLATSTGEKFEPPRLVKVKISDTASDTAVYGVYASDSTVNDGDITVESLGLGLIRINSSVSVSNGDLIESNGDGTGKVQSDTIIRSSTVAKVTSTEKVETYKDGSYLVPCTLHCG